MATQSLEIPQYKPAKILIVWSAAAVPMGILGWLVAPALMSGSSKPGFERLGVLTVGLIWQFILVLILIYDEAGTLKWSVVRERLWLQTPKSPRTGRQHGKLWWWLIPLVLVTATYQLLMSGPLQKLWTSFLPFLAEPSGFGFASALNAPEARAQLIGNWGVLALFIVSALFNTVLGEELLFRGLLLPRMAGVFGGWSWLANGFLFGLYHLHQPWGMATSIIQGVFLFALPTKVFRSAWFGIIAHSGQSLYFVVLLLGLVLGFAH